ncbi:YafY family protein [Paenibacillus sp. R14(2021)]|uniref:helix-turn-helix transcriptional regulator n=1 Tax=Paenibacillus sp. R14(2021) TaxID=2859228 RepID=UPI001C6161A0|nr:WYL domain-containing protein [Paenibacillus sp. R14(2021)]
MGNTHRIRWFDGQIREGKYPNSSLLAEQFELSKRQAQRDIEYLAYSLSAPLLYVAKRRGYCYEDKTYALPLLYMTDEEKKILNYLARRYRQYNYDGAPAVNRIANLLDRFAPDEALAAELRLPVFETNPQLIDKFDRLTAAIAAHSVVTLSYHEDADAEMLTFWPLTLFSRFNCDYVAGYSVTQQKQRTLRLDCIAGLTVTASCFDPHTVEAVEWHSGGSNGPVKKPFAARLQFDTPLPGVTWHGYRIQAAEEDFVYTLEFHDTDAFLRQLWSSPWTKLLAPKWLKARLVSQCADIRRRLTDDEKEVNFR